MAYLPTWVKKVSKMISKHLRFTSLFFSISIHWRENTAAWKVEKILKGSLDLIPSPSVKIQILGGKVCLRCKGIAGPCQQTFENKTFVDITQQYFTLLPQVNFPANIVLCIKKQKNVY